MLSTRKGRAGREQRSLPMPLQTQAQRVTEAQPTVGALPELCLPPAPARRAPSTCMPPPRPHPAFLSPYPTSRLSPPPQSPSTGGPLMPASWETPSQESQLQAWASRLHLLVGKMGLQSAGTPKLA